MASYTSLKSDFEEYFSKYLENKVNTLFFNIQVRLSDEESIIVELINKNNKEREFEAIGLYFNRLNGWRITEGGGLITSKDNAKMVLAMIRGVIVEDFFFHGDLDEAFEGLLKQIREVE